MKRQLALTAGTRTHPMRDLVRHNQAVARKRREDGDMKLFVLSFTAFFVCFYTFLM